MENNNQETSISNISKEEIKEENSIKELSKTPKRKKNRIFYWIIVIFGMMFIMITSMQIGYKFEEIVDGNSKTNKNNENSPEKKQSDIESIPVKILTEEEALELGNNLYNKGKQLLNNKLNTTEGCTSTTIDGEYYMDCTALYKTLLTIFASENKVGRNSSSTNDIFVDFVTKNNDGKKYLDATGSGFNGKVETVLSIVKIEETEITFNATSEIYVIDSSNNLTLQNTEINQFVIVKDDEDWKISYLVALGI